MINRNGEVWVGDVIEFKTDPQSNGVIVSMIDKAGEQREVVEVDERGQIVAMVIHQSSDRKFATWEVGNLPRPFTISYRSARIN